MKLCDEIVMNWVTATSTFSLMKRNDVLNLFNFNSLIHEQTWSIHTHTEHAHAMHKVIKLVFCCFVSCVKCVRANEEVRMKEWEPYTKPEPCEKGYEFIWKRNCIQCDIILLKSYVDASNETYTLTLTGKIQEPFIYAEQKHRIIWNTSYNKYWAHEHYFASSFCTLHHSFSLFFTVLYTHFAIVFCCLSV